MPEHVYRQWMMLRMIPRAPQKIDPASIEQKLAEQGLHIHRRSIQRDLQRLSAVFPLVSDERSKPFGWSWAEEALPMDLPGMDPNTALTFRLAQQFLALMMPLATLRFLRPHFAQAGKILSVLKDAPAGIWPKKVRVISMGQPLIPAAIRPEILETVYDAVGSGRRLYIHYRPRGEKKSKRMEVNPLGLVFRPGVIYLVVTPWNSPHVIQLVLHRMTQAAITDKPAKLLAGFDLDSYIEAGAFGFMLGTKPIKLKVRMWSVAAEALHETPLAKDQTINPDGPEHIILRATMPDTMTLRHWLLGFGEYVEVLKPASLRKEFTNRARGMAGIYLKDKTLSPA